MRQLQEQADELRRTIRQWANPRRTLTATADGLPTASEGDWRSFIG